jgi:hypothetical protein
MKAALLAVVLLASLIQKGMSLQVMTQDNIIRILVQVQVLITKQLLNLKCLLLLTTHVLQPSIMLPPTIVLPALLLSPVKLKVSVVKDYSTNGHLLALGTALLQGRLRRLFLLNTSIPMTLVFTLA